MGLFRLLFFVGFVDIFGLCGSALFSSFLVKNSAVKPSWNSS